MKTYTLKSFRTVFKGVTLVLHNGEKEISTLQVFELAMGIWNTTSLLEEEKMLMKLAPHIVCKIWGGTKLNSLKSKNSSEPIGESWEVSALKEGPSYFEKRPLSELVEFEKLPYLIKLIDTSDHLSVQVHPDETYAKQNENAQGKTECWLILDAAPGAGIYLGFKPGVTKEKFEKAIRSSDDLTPFLRFFPVKRGDFFFVPAGSVHAIGKDVFLAEVQESSGITYRVWDWNRLENGKPRTLHIDKALDVLNFDNESNEPMSFCAREDLFSFNGEERLLEERLFNLDLVNLVPDEVWEREIASEQRHMSVLCLGGEGIIVLGEEEVSLSSYEAILIPAESQGRLEIQAKDKCSFIFVS